MGILTEWITEWLKGLLIEGIMGNLTGLFDTVNTRVGEIAVQVGTPPAAWNAGVFSLIRQISETVILPIAGLILTFVATYELIQMLIDRNNLHDIDTWIFFKWIERTVIDRCVRQVYREMALGLENAKTPLLQDLYEELLKQPEPEAKRVATALELYCTGSLNLFNHHTNVQTSNRVVCIVLKGMGENLRKIAMHITNEFVTQAVDENYRAGVATWCYFDEFHVLLRDQLTASYFVAVWKMLRKKGCVPSALTQNVKDLLASAEISNILDNTDFMILLSQAQSDRAILAKQLGISEHQLSYITHSNAGEGLLFYGNVTIPFIDRFPRGEIYDLLTTRPEDMAHERKDE